MTTRIGLITTITACMASLLACSAEPNAGYCEMRTEQNSSERLRPADAELCSMDDGVDAARDASCGQCGYDCLDGCAHGTCAASLLVASTVGIKGPIEAEEFLVIAKDKDAGERIVRVSSDGTQQGLATTQGRLAQMTYHDGWIYWLDSPPGGPDRLDRIQLRDSSEVTNVATNARMRLLDVTDRGAYVLAADIITVLDVAGGGQPVAQFDVPEDATVRATFEHDSRLLVVLEELGIYEAPLEGGELEPALSTDEDRLNRGASRHQEYMYLTSSGRDDTPTEHHWAISRLDLSTSPMKLETVVLWASGGTIPGISAPTVQGDKLWWQTSRSLHYYPRGAQEPMELSGSTDEVWGGALRHAVHRHPSLGPAVVREDAVYFSGGLDDCDGDTYFGLLRVPLAAGE